MIGRTRVAFKFLTYGMLVGLLFAPRSGRDSRAAAVEWVKSTVRGMFGG